MNVDSQLLVTNAGLTLPFAVLIRAKSLPACTLTASSSSTPVLTTHTQTDIQTDRQTDTHTDTDRRVHSQHPHLALQYSLHTHRQDMQTHTHTQTYTQTDTQTYRQTCILTDRERQLYR